MRSLFCLEIRTVLLKPPLEDAAQMEKEPKGQGNPHYPALTPYFTFLPDIHGTVSCLQTGTEAEVWHGPDSCTLYR